MGPASAGPLLMELLIGWPGLGPSSCHPIILGTSPAVPARDSMSPGRPKGPGAGRVPAWGSGLRATRGFALMDCGNFFGFAATGDFKSHRCGVGCGDGPLGNVLTAQA